ncbi:uncharacterized protein TNCV_3247551 [Trichonephila clavipes]|nr:uncharacterized protein TNCV_3247551 [Trichonephila clavipes]
MRVLYRSRQNDRLRVMLVLVHIDIPPSHTPLPVFRRIGERTIPYSRRAGSPTKEGRFVLGTFRSERMRVLYRSRQNDRLRVMLVLVHIDIPPSHTPLPVFRRIGERTIPYSWRAGKQLRHLVVCVIRA